MRTYLLLSISVIAFISSAAASLPRPDHIVLVIEENHSFAEIIRNSAAPYINSLAQQGALFTSSHAITHPSEPNYLALYSGSTQGITDDSCPNTFCASNLGGSLLSASLTFAGFSEDLPELGSTVCNAGQYYRKHNPWVNFTDVPASSNVPFSSFPADYSQLPTVAFVVPNQDNDMHDGSITQGDTWLKAHLDAYVQWAQVNNSLLIVTFDEDDGNGGNQIVTLFVGPMVVAGQYSESINHYSVLRTIEDMYGLAAVGVSANTLAISDVWLGAASAVSSSSDSDGDGIPDELETALGSDPLDAASTPSETVAGAPVVLSLGRLSIRLNFSLRSTDSIRMMATLPIPQGFTAVNQPLVVDVGGAIGSFTLDSRGSASSGQNSLRLALKQGKVQQQKARLSMSLRNGNFASVFRDEGLTNDPVRQTTRRLPVFVLFNGISFHADAPLIYTTKIGKIGLARSMMH